LFLSLARSRSQPKGGNPLVLVKPGLPLLVYSKYRSLLSKLRWYTVLPDVWWLENVIVHGYQPFSFAGHRILPLLLVIEIALRVLSFSAQAR
jgi:hypothetical protein